MSLSETSTPHCFLWENSTGKAVTLRNYSHAFLLPFGLPQTGHNPGKLQFPKLTPVAL